VGTRKRRCSRAPTAGFILRQEIFDQLGQKGIQESNSKSSLQRECGELSMPIKRAKESNRTSMQYARQIHVRPVGLATANESDDRTAKVKIVRVRTTSIRTLRKVCYWVWWSKTIRERGRNVQFEKLVPYEDRINRPPSGLKRPFRQFLTDAEKNNLEIIMGTTEHFLFSPGYQ